MGEIKFSYILQLTRETSSNYISICANNTSVTKLDTCMIVGGQSGFLFRDSKPLGRHWIFIQNQSGETRHL